MIEVTCEGCQHGNRFDRPRHRRLGACLIDDALPRFRAEGRTIAEMAKAVGLSEKAIQDRPRHLGLTSPRVAPSPRPKRAPKRSREEKIREWAELYIADGKPEHVAWSDARAIFEGRD